MVERSAVGSPFCFVGRIDKHSMLPEIIDRLKSAFSGFGGPPISLGLKEVTYGNWGIPYGSDGNVDWYARNGFSSIVSALGASSPAWSGESVTVSTALNHSVVWSCVSRISGAVGFLPLQMMRRTGGDEPGQSKTSRAGAHPIYSALHDAPNDEMTAMDFRSSRMCHVLLLGSAYAQILRRSGTGVAYELQALDPSQVRIDREKEGGHRLVYLVKDGNSQEKSYTVQRGKPQDILHIRGLGWDGIQGYSVIAMARQSIGTALAAERHLARFYQSGGRLPYILNLEKNWGKDTEDAKKFRADWNAIYSDPHQAPMLEPWVKYQQIGVSAKDAQTLEMLQWNPSEICRWFDLSPHLAGDLSNGSYANIETLAQEFVTLTLSKWLVSWEQALWRCVLTPDEKSQGYFFKHNVNALLRGDFATRMQGYSAALQNGFLNRDEVRDLEDRNPIPDGAGQDFTIQLNMQGLPPGGLPNQPPAQAPIVKLGNKKVNGFPHIDTNLRDRTVQ